MVGEGGSLTRHFRISQSGRWNRAGPATAAGLRRSGSGCGRPSGRLGGGGWSRRSLDAERQRQEAAAEAHRQRAVEPLLHRHALAPQARPNVLARDLVESAVEPQRAIVADAAALDAAQDGGQIVLRVERPMSVGGAGRRPCEALVPGRQPDPLQVFVGGLEGRRAGLAAGPSPDGPERSERSSRCGP